MIILFWSKKCWKSKKANPRQNFDKKQLNGSQIYMPTSACYQFITSHLKIQIRSLILQKRDSLSRIILFPSGVMLSFFRRERLEQVCRIIFSGSRIFSLTDFFWGRRHQCPGPSLHWAFAALWSTSPRLLKWGRSPQHGLVNSTVSPALVS